MQKQHETSMIFLEIKYSTIRYDIRCLNEKRATFYQFLQANSLASVCPISLWKFLKKLLWTVTF